MSVRRLRVSESAVPADDLVLVQSELQRHEHLRYHRAIVAGDAIVIYAPSVNEAELRRLTHGITTLCAALSIPFDPDRRAHLLSLDIAGLEALLTKIGTEHRWPGAHALQISTQ